MDKVLWGAGIAALAAAVLAAIIIWRRHARRAKQNKEQIDRVVKEKALDRALSNDLRQGSQPRTQAQQPLEVHYNSKASQTERGTVLRLTEQAESVTKEYLFRRTDVVYIGEEYGRAAIFRERGKNKTHCEIFPYQGEVYIRLCGRAVCRLLRGKQSASLTEKAICLRSGDRVETQSGIFLVELI